MDEVAPQAAGEGDDWAELVGRITLDMLRETFPDWTIGAMRRRARRRGRPAAAA